MLEMLPFLLKKILSALILPPTSLILLTFVGLWLSRKHPRAGRTLAALSLAIQLILSLPITGNALLRSLETSPPITEAQLEDSHAIVILGGGKDNQAPEFDEIDTINRWTLQRLRYGAHLQEKVNKPILVTGGAPYGGRPEADAMAETLLRDFHAKDIWTESQSKDTAENATYSAAILKEHGIQRVAIVSQAWHLQRATQLFETQGLRVYPAPTGFTTEERLSIAQWLPEASALNKSSIAFKEYLGLIVLKATK